MPCAMAAEDNGDVAPEQMSKKKRDAAGSSRGGGCGHWGRLETEEEGKPKPAR